MEPPHKPIGHKSEAPRGASTEPRIIEAPELFSGHREVIIVHNDERYRLRVTSKGKLILTK